jgi:hypothetical protein
MARSIPTDQQLLNKRADVNATADNGASALGNAVARADVGLVRALLAARRGGCGRCGRLGGGYGWEGGQRADRAAAQRGCAGAAH